MTLSERDVRRALDELGRLRSRAPAVLAEQEGVSLRAGQQRLRALARSSGRSLTEVAADVAASPRPDRSP